MSNLSDFYNLKFISLDYLNRLDFYSSSSRFLQESYEEDISKIFSRVSDELSFFENEKSCCLENSVQFFNWMADFYSKMFIPHG